MKSINNKYGCSFLYLRLISYAEAEISIGTTSTFLNGGLYDPPPPPWPPPAPGPPGPPPFRPPVGPIPGPCWATPVTPALLANRLARALVSASSNQPRLCVSLCCEIGRPDLLYPSLPTSTLSVNR